METALLEVKNLAIHFQIPGTAGETTGIAGGEPTGVIKAVDGVSFQVFPGETFGLVGESGCGKSVTALSLLKLLPTPPAVLAGGEVIYRPEKKQPGKDLWQLPHGDLIKLRGREISLIFQEPMTSLNPVMKIGRQIGEALRIHSPEKALPAKELRRQVLEMLARVGIHQPERAYEAYPHELSGGMRQRAMIAMALICRPKLVIADEPTTALDVTIQAQILELLKELQVSYNLSLLLITHNLGIIAETAHRVAVMYMGRIVELAPVKELFHNPLHPYTLGLLASIPRLDREEELKAIPGMIPDPLRLPAGCHFAPRCPRVMEVCHKEYPVSREAAPGHTVACWLQDK